MQCLFVSSCLVPDDLQQESGFVVFYPLMICLHTAVKALYPPCPSPDLSRSFSTSCCSPLAVLWSSSRLTPVGLCISCSTDSCRVLDAAGLPCCKSALRTEVQIVYSQILFSKATFHLGRAQLVLFHGAQPVPGTGLSICLSWTSFGFCQPISPGCYGLLAAAVPCSGSQLLPPIWYHLQTWRAFIPNAQTINNFVRKHWP